MLRHHVLMFLIHFLRVYCITSWSFFSHDVLMMTPIHSLMCPSRLFRHTALIGHAPVGSVCSIQSGCVPAQLQLSDKVNVSANFPKAVGVCSPTCSRHSELTFSSCLHLRGRVAAKARAWGVQWLIPYWKGEQTCDIYFTYTFFFFLLPPLGRMKCIYTWNQSAFCSIV